MPNRYLTPAEKAAHLEAWLRDDAVTDPGARELLEPLNLLEGVCTVQSCIGHSRPLRDGGVEVLSGHIEMRLDQEMVRRFYAAAPALASLTGVEDVVISQRPGREVCAVWFAPGEMPVVVVALVGALTQNEAAPRCEVASRDGGAA